MKGDLTVKVINRHHHKGEWPPHHFYIGRPGGIARGAIDAEPQSEAEALGLEGI